jgi:hypothetical protein
MGRWADKTTSLNEERLKKKRRRKEDKNNSGKRKKEDSRIKPYMEIWKMAAEGMLWKVKIGNPLRE